MDAVLHAPKVPVAGQQLTQVTVSAVKPTPVRGADTFGPGVGATERQQQGVAAALAPDERGDLMRSR